MHTKYTITVSLAALVASLVGMTYAQQHTIENLANYASVVNPLLVKTGDTIVLPEGEYRAINTRVLKVEGNVATVLMPGIVGLQKVSDGAVETTGAILSVPDPIGNGRVFLWNPNHWSWQQNGWVNTQGGWTNLATGQSNEAPMNPNDIAIMARYNDWAFEVNIEQNISLGGLMVGAYTFDKNGDDYKFRLRGAASGAERAKLTFATTEKKTNPWIQVCPGGSIWNERINVAFGAQDRPLELVLGGDVVCDLGWDGVDSGACAAKMTFDKGSTVNIPEGKSLKFVNGTPKQDGGLMSIVEAKGALTGAGTLENNARISLRADFDATGFTGTLKEASGPREGYDRNANTWFADTASFGNATLEISGFVKRTDYKSYAENQSGGIFRIGQNHTWPGQEEIGNRLPGTVVLNGGFLELYNEQKTWSAGVKCEYVADTMSVANGTTLMYAIGNGDESYPEVLAGATHLTHPGKGALVVRCNRLWPQEHSDRVEVCFPDGAAHMVGGIIPWLAAWSDQPDYGQAGGWESLRFPTLDADGNLRNLESGNTKVDDAAENANVYSSGLDLKLTANKTINSLAFSNTYNGSNKINEGMTLTIASGGLIMNSKARIGGHERAQNEPSSRNGTLAFGRTAYIFSNNANGPRSDGGKNMSWIMAKIVAPEGLVMAHPGYLSICGDQRGIDGEIVVSAGELTLGIDGVNDEGCDLNIPCQIDVPVRLVGGGSRLVLAAGTKLDRTQNVIFDDVGGHAGQIEIPEGNDQDCVKCYVAGVTLPRGTWGATGSGAENIDDEHFVGTGVLKVRKDDLNHPMVITIR